MSTADVDLRILLSVAAVIAASQVFGWLAGRVRQPRVLGEIVAGILLGPSLLGAVWPDALGFLFPTEVVGGLKAIAQLGLVLFMFTVGLDLDLDHLRGQGHRAIVISHASIILPFGLGALVAIALHDEFGAGSDALSFSLFVGIAMAITAFPVLARVLQEANLDSTRIGALALTCAAVDDVTAWCGLAVVVAFVEASDASGVLITVGASLAFLLVMFGAVRPLLARSVTPPLAAAVAIALLSAWITEAIGIHAIFGAFVAGTVMPRSDRSRSQLGHSLELVTTTVLLPMFFMVVGLSTRFGLLDSARLWLVALLIVAVAIVGKLGGSSIAARLMGETWRDAVTIGVLMNTRGLTEIVILTVGLELGVIDQRMFTIMVVMALVTTFMAGPLLSALASRAPGATDGKAVGFGPPVST